jgi:DNA replicative helicase MCM subunit Mcm2 (Cdc46/Mcm family)
MTECIKINNLAETFTDSALTEKIKKELASTKIDKEKYKQEIEKRRLTKDKNYYDYDQDLDFCKDPKILDDRKYYYRAFHYQKIGLLKKEDIPWLKISLKDLSLESLKALSQLEQVEREYIAKQSYGKIFEDVNSNIYRNSISSIFKVKFIDGHSYDSAYTIINDNIGDDNINSSKNDLIAKILSEQLIVEHDDDVESNLKLEEQKSNSIPILSVAEALRSNEGEIKVNGTIVSVTSLFKMVSEIHTQCNICQDSQNIVLEKPEFQPRSIKKCSNCNEDSILTNCGYVSAVKITLQDISNFNETDQLTVLLFEKDTINIVVGEQVVISGNIYITQDTRQGKLYSVLYANRLEYQNKAETSLSKMDIGAIERFTKNAGGSNNDIIDKLVEMSFPNVIGYKFAKKGLLLSLVNSVIDTRENRKRIHVLAIGNLGVGKTTLLRAAVHLDPNGRFESGQHSSGKGLTAIISKEENDRYVLRLGAVSLANGSVCGINEIGRMNPEEQAYFLDVMEEGDFTINKHGINAKIKASTTIFASANPRQQNFTEFDTISLDNIPAINALLDRFDLIFDFSRSKDPEELREYINIKSEREDTKQPDYTNYIKKHIVHSKKFNPILTAEAKSILNEYFIELLKGRSNFITLRRRESLYRLARAIARIKLKDIVDVNDAREATEFYNVMISKFLQTVKIPENPRDLTVKICIEILKEHKSNAISFQDLVIKAKQENQQVRDYIGYDLKMQSNYKLRAVCELITNNSNIKIVNEKPIVLKYIEELSEFSSI